MVTIITPVYNTQKYLSQCINSVRNQTISDFQVILVDDGSSDDSSITCDDFCLTDERIMVIHKVNAGPSVARNVALDVTTGDYVFFLDSDDWIECNGISDILMDATNADLIANAYTRVDENGSILKKQFSTPTGLFSREEMLHFLLYEREYGFLGFIFPKLFRMELIQNFGIRFATDLKHNEDRVFVTQFTLYASTFRFNNNNNNNYLYRQRNESLSHSIDEHVFDPEALHELIGFERIKEMLYAGYKREWHRTARLIFEKSLYWYKKIPKEMAEQRRLNCHMLNKNTLICIMDPNQGLLYKIKVMIHWIMKK